MRHLFYLTDNLGDLRRQAVDDDPAIKNRRAVLSNRPSGSDGLLVTRMYVIDFLEDRRHFGVQRLLYS